jgi:hypothetical protein
MNLMRDVQDVLVTYFPIKIELPLSCDDRIEIVIVG